ncbi:AMP-binding protein [Burkholderia sp. FERM BP-3421]|jgi:acyl-CoA synthetase (AMP-forming)/AMP-acid ligase II|uniref:class I adenylate-forming enzyme family protein n=1 Tax=Burkholderia sp. FERM BP-3421 TaxID=1494466 RepID=UPI0023622D77|nr:AMP-binding protein [Burkholderia sp. FERM BP-3421]WDD92459.1 AMP-binding protein [Burkholderia sp. FERM BP-3421]
MNYNLSDLLAHRAYLAPTHEGFVGPDYRYSYAEVDRRCTRFAAWLRAAGLAPGDRIAVYGKNSAALATAIFGASRADAIVVVMNWRLQVDELAYMLDHSGARALFYDAAFAPAVEALRARCGGLDLLVCHGDAARDPRFDDLVDAAAPALPPCPPATRRGDDAAVIMYTSGTTGRPKGAMLTHDNFLAAAHGTSSTLDWFDSHRFLLVAPMFHIGGLMPLTTSVQKGTMVYFLPDFDPAAIWRVIGRERITTMMLVPAMLSALLAAASQVDADPSSLVHIVCGASTVPRALIDAWAALGVGIQQVYGLTEVTGALTFWKAAMDPAKADSHGKAAFLNRLRIVDPHTGAPLPAGVCGEIQCAGAVVFAGYWNDPGATRAALRDGWLATGDLGYLDEAGFLYVIDRLKDLIISGGENIYPSEVERVLLAEDGVAEAAVVGVPDEKWGESPIAFVVRRPGATVTGDALLDACRARLARFKCPKAVRFVDALPRSGVGKVVKTTLRERARSGAGDDD